MFTSLDKYTITTFVYNIIMFIINSEATACPSCLLITAREEFETFCFVICFRIFHIIIVLILNS